MINITTLILHFAVGWILLWLATQDLGVVHKSFMAITARVSAGLWWYFKLIHIKTLEDNDVDLLVAQVALLVLLILLSLSVKNLMKLVKSWQDKSISS